MGRAWPSNLLPTQLMFHPDIPSASGGPGFGGAEQVVFSSAGRWRAQLKISVLRLLSASPGDRILSARALLAYLKGRSNTIYVPVFDQANAPSTLGGVSAATTLTLHSDGTSFGDGTKYSQPATNALLVASAAQGALAATVSSPFTISGGQYFGFGVSELYLMDSATDIGGGNFAITFWPPLRSAHAAGEAVNFDTPTCEMRMATDDSGQISFAAPFIADMTIDLVEAL